MDRKYDGVDVLLRCLVSMLLYWLLIIAPIDHMWNDRVGASRYELSEARKACESSIPRDQVCTPVYLPEEGL